MQLSIAESVLVKQSHFEPDLLEINQLNNSNHLKTHYYIFYDRTLYHMKPSTSYGYILTQNCFYAQGW